MQIHEKPCRLVKVFSLLLLIVLSACADLDVATKPEEVNAITKIRSGEYELIAKTELAQLRKDAEVGRTS